MLRNKREDLRTMRMSSDLAQLAHFPSPVPSPILPIHINLANSPLVSAEIPPSASPTKLSKCTDGATPTLACNASHALLPLSSLYIIKFVMTGPGTTAIAAARIAPNCTSVSFARVLTTKSKPAPNVNSTSPFAARIPPQSPADYFCHPPFHHSFSPRSAQLPLLLPASCPTFLDPSLYHSRLISTVLLMPMPSLLHYHAFLFEHSRVVQTSDVIP